MQTETKAVSSVHTQKQFLSKENNLSCQFSIHFERTDGRLIFIILPAVCIRVKVGLSR
jgi:hypothetical protein